MKRLFLACLMSVAMPALALADTVNVAVAANFTDAAKDVAAAFAKASGHTAELSFGATGALYTQIAQGAPFQVFLAADDVRPTKAVTDGLGVEGTVFTYAIGQLVLYSAEAGKVNGPETLTQGDFEKIAIANPETAPYGAAAVETMKALDVFTALEPKIVQGQNIGQTFQFVESGNAEVGFVALGQVALTEAGSRWVVPQNYYEPIRQDAVLLKTGAENPAATAFVEFLQGPEAAEIIKHYGYALSR